uniref:Metalloendopeptidase n=1 Tax=Caenorhabditis tropicalis TaxID=1561998 RepID=A0A1I7TJ47_9PELO
MRRKDATTFTFLHFDPAYQMRPPPPRPWGPPPWHRLRGPPPFGPPPPWDRPPPPWRRRPWHRRPPWDFPPPPPPPPPEPQQDQPQVMFSQDIDKVVNSVNQNTAAFQRQGESYDKVIQIMSSYFNRKSGSQYDMNAVIPSSGIQNNELTANSKIAAVICYSSVGRLGGAQEISIGYGCETLGIITHEVGHALGFWHEQARPERDSYVRINRQNAINGLEGQFDKRSWSEVNEYSLPYDYGSVMHYGPKSFSRSSTLNTVEPVDAAFINTIGNRVEPSFLDLKLLNTAFCSNMCTNKINCQHGGYPDPNNCGQCKCPTGLEGTYCERLQTSNCGVELPRADYTWRNISYSGSSDCYWRIVAANGGNVRFEITYVMYRCSPVCEEFVEIKAEYSHEATGYRQCCRAILGERISKGNSVLIISKATQNSQFVLRYRAGDQSDKRECVILNHVHKEQREENAVF